MAEPFLAVNFTLDNIKAFSVENKEGNIRVLDSLTKNYQGQFSRDIEWELLDLILTMEKRLGVYFRSAIIGVKGGPKIISKNKFCENTLKNP